MAKLPQPTGSKNQSLLFRIGVGLIIFLATYLRLINLDQPRQYIFDEDFFALTSAMIAQGQIVAYQFWHQPFSDLQSSYLYRPPAVEWLHPPLAKLLMATTIKLSGNTSVGWRLAPAMSGVLLVIITIWLSRRLWPQRQAVALLAGLLVAVDHLLVVESRLAGANMVLTILTTLTVCLTYIYEQKLQITKFQSAQWPYLLLWAGSAGLAISTKWSAGFIWLGCWMWLIYQLHLSPVKNKLRWLGLKMVIFITVAGLVYLFSYGQYFYLSKFDLSGWWRLQSAMVSYQTTTSEQHAYQSRPWQWPLGQVTIPYFLPDQKQVDQPAIWASSWLLPLGWLAFLSTLIKLALTQKKNPVDSGQTLLILTVVCFWLPWFLIPRNLFLYHILPALPLLLILLSYRLMDLCQWLVSTAKKSKR